MKRPPRSVVIIRSEAIGDAALLIGEQRAIDLGARLPGVGVVDRRPCSVTARGGSR